MIYTACMLLLLTRTLSQSNKHNECEYDEYEVCNERSGSICRATYLYDNHNEYCKSIPPSNTSSNATVMVMDPTSLLSARITRLEYLAVQRQDLVDDYNENLIGDRTILHMIMSHAVKAIKSRHILPVTDPECSWNILKDRCEPVYFCSWQYKIGDLYPGRSCRLNKNVEIAYDDNYDGSLLVQADTGEGKLKRKRLSGPFSVIKRLILLTYLKLNIFHIFDSFKRIIHDMKH